MHKRILVVEDEASIRDMVAFALRKADMEVIHAADARAALDVEQTCRAPVQLHDALGG